MVRWRTQHWPAEAQGLTPAAQRAEAEKLTHMERDWARVTPKRDCLQRAAACFASTQPLSHPAHAPHARRAVHNRIRLSETQVIHRESRETYGRPSIGDALVKRGGGTRLVSIACPGSCELNGFAQNPSRNSVR